MPIKAAIILAIAIAALPIATSCRRSPPPQQGSGANSARNGGISSYPRIDPPIPDSDFVGEARVRLRNIAKAFFSDKSELPAADKLDLIANDPAIDQYFQPPVHIKSISAETEYLNWIQRRFNCQIVYHRDAVVLVLSGSGDNFIWNIIYGPLDVDGQTLMLMASIEGGGDIAIEQYSVPLDD